MNTSGPRLPDDVLRDRIIRLAALLCFVTVYQRFAQAIKGGLPSWPEGLQGAGVFEWLFLVLGDPVLPVLGNLIAALAVAVCAIGTFRSLPRYAMLLAWLGVALWLYRMSWSVKFAFTEDFKSPADLPGSAIIQLLVNAPLFVPWLMQKPSIPLPAWLAQRFLNEDESVGIAPSQATHCIGPARARAVRIAGLFAFGLFLIIVKSSLLSFDIFSAETENDRELYVTQLAVELIFQVFWLYVLIRGSVYMLRLFKLDYVASKRVALAFAIYTIAISIPASLVLVEFSGELDDLWRDFYVFVGGSLYFGVPFVVPWLLLRPFREQLAPPTDDEAAEPNDSAHSPA